MRGRKVASVIVNIIIWLFVALCVVITVLAFAQVSNNYNVPSIGRTVILSVRSDSMKPEFSLGDIIIGKKVNSAEIASLQEGDVITFSTDDLDGDGYRDLNTHRITEVIKDTKDNSIAFVTHGDNNPESMTEYVTKNDVVCKYNGTRLPGMGRMLSFLQTPRGFFIAVIIPLIIFFLAELYIFIHKYRKIRYGDAKEITEEEEELIKQKAVEEYINSEKAKNEKPD